MSYVITGADIPTFRLKVLASALSLEIKGLKRRGFSAYAVAKREFNLKGSRESVLAQLQELMTTN